MVFFWFGWFVVVVFLFVFLWVLFGFGLFSWFGYFWLVG